MVMQDWTAGPSTSRSPAEMEAASVVPVEGVQAVETGEKTVTEEEVRFFGIFEL